jgi:hypothetical protein
MAVGEIRCRRAHRTVRCATGTVRCASHVTQPLGFDRWSFWQLGHRTVRWCIEQVLFTVRCAFWRLPWLYARSSHCSLFTFAVDHWRSSRCSRWHTGQSGATPDSPVNYSGEHFLGTRSWGVRSDSPWCIRHCPVVHRTQSGGTPDSPVRQTRAAFSWICSFLFEPYLGLLSVWVEPLAPVELII